MLMRKNTILIHSGEKAYKCSQCDVSFARKVQLNSHILIHSGEKEIPYNCSQSDTYLGDRRSCPSKVKGLPYSCIACQKNVNGSQHALCCSICNNGSTVGATRELTMLSTALS